MSSSFPPCEPVAVDVGGIGGTAQEEPQSMQTREEWRREDDPLIQAVLSAPPARRGLTDDERDALEEYRRTKRSSRGA